MVCLFLFNSTAYESSLTPQANPIDSIHNLGIAVGDILGLRDWDTERIEMATRSLLTALTPEGLALKDIDLRAQLENSQELLQELNFGPLIPCAYGASLVGDNWHMRWWVVDEYSEEPRPYVAEFPRTGALEVHVRQEEGTGLFSVAKRTSKLKEVGAAEETFIDIGDIISTAGNIDLEARLNSILIYKRFNPDEKFLVLHEIFQEIVERLRNNELSLTNEIVKKLLRTARLSKEEWTRAFARELLYWELIYKDQAFRITKIIEGLERGGETGFGLEFSEILKCGRKLDELIGEFEKIIPKKPDIKEKGDIKKFVRGTSAFLPFIHKHSVLPIVVFDGKLLKDYPGIEEYEGVLPLRLYVTGREKITDERIRDGILYEGVRLAEAMAWKNPLWQVFFSGRKGIHAAQGDAFISVSTLYADLELFRLGLVMGKGGDRLDQHRRIAGDISLETEREIFEEYTKAMVVARVLGYTNLSGPDRVRDVDNKMGYVLKATEEIADLWNNETTRDDFKLVPCRTTTSAPREYGSFSHLNWYVTSLGAVNGLLAILRNKRFREHIKEQTGVDLQKEIPIIIQGFGDVGSGIFMSFIDSRVAKLYEGLVRFMGISNVNCSVYSKKGLPKEALKILRKAIERTEDPDSVNIFDYIDLNEVNKAWLSPKALLIYLSKQSEADQGKFRAVKEKLESGNISKDEEKNIIGTLKEEGVIPESVVGMDVNELLYEEAAIRILAAVSNVFTKVEQVKRLKREGRCILIVEGANNAVIKGLEPTLTSALMFYFRGELENGGGILTSKEEMLHWLFEQEHMLDERYREHFRLHVQCQIVKYVRALSYVVMRQFEESGFKADITEIVYTLSRDIKIEQGRLLLNIKEGDLIDIEARGNVRRSKGRLPYRIAILETASERAFTNVVYKGYLLESLAKEGKGNLLKDIVLDEQLKADTKNIFSDAQDTRMIAILALGRLGEKAAKEELWEVLRDENEGKAVRDAAAESLGYIYGYVGDEVGILENPIVRGMYGVAGKRGGTQAEREIADSAQWALEKMGVWEKLESAESDKDQGAVAALLRQDTQENKATNTEITEILPVSKRAHLGLVKKLPKGETGVAEASAESIVDYVDKWQNQSTTHRDLTQEKVWDHLSDRGIKHVMYPAPRIDVETVDDIVNTIETVTDVHLVDICVDMKLEMIISVYLTIFTDALGFQIASADDRLIIDRREDGLVEISFKEDAEKGNHYAIELTDKKGERLITLHFHYDDYLNPSPALMSLKSTIDLIILKHPGFSGIPSQAISAHFIFFDATLPFSHPGTYIYATDTLFSLKREMLNRIGLYATNCSTSFTKDEDLPSSQRMFIKPSEYLLTRVKFEPVTAPDAARAIGEILPLAERAHRGLIKKLPQGKTRVIVDEDIFEQGAYEKDVLGRLLNGRYIATGDICNLEKCNTKNVDDILITLRRVEHPPEKTIVQVSSNLSPEDIERLRSEAPGVRFMRVDTNALDVKYNDRLDSKIRWRLRFSLYGMLLAARDITDDDIKLKEASPTYRLLHFFLKTHGAEDPDSYIEELARDNVAFLINYALSFVPTEPWSKTIRYYLIGITYISGSA